MNRITINIYLEVICLDKEISYVIGSHSYTKKRKLLDSQNMKIVDKQLKLSIPLITGARIESKNWKKQIFIGKEIDLRDIPFKSHLFEKYDVSLEDLIDISLKGFKRVCLLNYKKYDQILMGVCEEDIIVPDYYAFRNVILQEVNS